jgi:hypothetical protein
MTGTASKKEKRAAAGRSRWRVMPPVMVAPEREMPGKSEMAWKQPTHSASNAPTDSSGRFFLPAHSAMTSSRAVTSKK